MDRAQTISALLEVMRMPNGLQAVHSDLFYQARLVPGDGTSLGDESRGVTRRSMDIIRARWPNLRPAPTGSAYPVFINITAESASEEQGGTSRVNMYNASAIVDLVIWGVENGVVEPSQVGIATPYAAQATLYMNTWAKVQRDKPEYKWRSVRVGTTEWWQGKQAPWIIVNLVRASNDYAELGFVSDARRLNVLISRPEQSLFVIGDKDCTKILPIGNAKKDIRTQKDKDHENWYIINLYKWHETRGRVDNIPTKSMSTKCIHLTPISEATVSTSGPASGPPAAAAADWTSSACQCLNRLVRTDDNERKMSQLNV